MDIQKVQFISLEKMPICLYKYISIVEDIKNMFHTSVCMKKI